MSEIQGRTDVLKKTDERLLFIDDFNKRLGIFNTALTEMETWLLEGRKRIDAIIEPKADLSPEDRVTKAMEVQEDLLKKSDFTKKQELEKEDIFPKGELTHLNSVNQKLIPSGFLGPNFQQVGQDLSKPFFACNVLNFILTASLTQGTKRYHLMPRSLLPAWRRSGRLWTP